MVGLVDTAEFIYRVLKPLCTYDGHVYWVLISVVSVLFF